jgi:glycosyltransferase involved in cell wall biosynthesis
VRGIPVSLPRSHRLTVASRFRQLFASRLDVVLISQAHTYDFLHNKDLVAWLRTSRIPYVVVNHLIVDIPPLDVAKTKRADEFFGSAATVGFVAEHNIAAAERQLARYFTNAYVALNPTNLEDHSTVPWPSGREATLASVARLEVNHKGQDLLLQALAHPAWRDRSWQMRLYGEGPDRDYLARLVNHYQLRDRVVFEGHASDIRKVWATNQMLVVPSRVEGTPLALVEAMLCGRPAVVTDVGGNAEWVEDGTTGFVAPAANADSIRAALERAWQTQAAWEEIGRRAHQTAEDRRTQSAGEDLLEVLLAAAATKA